MLVVIFISMVLFDQRGDSRLAGYRSDLVTGFWCGAGLAMLVVLRWDSVGGFGGGFGGVVVTG